MPPNEPITEDFAEGVRTEKVFQLQWAATDKAKEPAEWFWLVGYLAGKALASHIAGNRTKALHHTITAAAALANWHDAIKRVGC